MIYSDDINRVCGLCCFSRPVDGSEKLYCTKRKKNTTATDGCTKFKYDIFKKPVRRKRRLKTNFRAEDFEL